MGSKNIRGGKVGAASSHELGFSAINEMRQRKVSS